MYRLSCLSLSFCLDDDGCVLDLFVRVSKHSIIAATFTDFSGIEKNLVPVDQIAMRWEFDEGAIWVTIIFMR